MHILHIISTLDPAKGGPGEGVRLLLSHQGEGWTGEVVTLDEPGAPFLHELPFPVHPLGPARGVYGYSSRLLPWLRRNRSRFDGFLLNGMWEYCGLATCLAAGRQTPYLVYAHGMLDPYFKRRFPRKHLKKALYWYPVEYWVLRRAARVLFTTRTEEELARKSFTRWRWRAAIVPYGMLPPRTSRAENIAALYAAVPEIQDRRYLVFLGRIHPKKGCDQLVRAFCDVAESDPDLHLLMAGPDRDGYSARLQSLAEDAGLADRIHWPGILRGPAKWGAFQAAEAFVLPSHQENFGIAVAEALACGRAVLLSDQVNIGSMIQDTGCALIRPDTLEGTRDLLRAWVSLSTGEHASMNENAARCFAERFDLRETVQTLRSLFAEAQQPGFARSAEGTS